MSMPPEPELISTGAAILAVLILLYAAFASQLARWWISMPMVFVCADGVLANSGREPFGLVGLETMAAGGTAFTGNTGEEYAQHMDNAVVQQQPTITHGDWGNRRTRHS
jgi:hypothetical protein